MAGRSSDDQFRIVQREIRESIRRNHPNPERVGCVGSDKLRQMAEGTVPPTDPAYHHVMECSPCYEELMECSERVAVARQAAESVRRRVFVGMIAAVAVVAAVLLYLLLPRSASKPGGAPSEIVGNQQTGGQVAVAMLNLDSQPTQRSGDGASQAGELQRLPRKPLNLTINLPRGLEEGEYEVQVAADPAKPLLTVSGNAQIQNGLTVLVVRVDLSRISPGKYRIAIRREGGSWRHTYVVVE
jgi:hypothetical protein